MDSLLTLPAANGSAIRILQITDTHLFAGKHESLLGVNTWSSYEAVLDAIIAQHRDYDLIIATGDLAQDHSVEAYQHFAEGISRLPRPCVWLPGNHDFQPAMVDTLADAHINPHKQVLIGEQWMQGLASSNSLGIIAGLVLGKPVGVTLFCFLAVAIGVSSLPNPLNWKHIFGAGILGGIGFTMSIFITNLAYTGNTPMIDASKMAILLASLLAGGLGILWLRLVSKPVAET